MIAQENQHQEARPAADRPVVIDSWWRTQSATMALLKHTQMKVDHAEERIRELEQRVRALEDMAASDTLTGLMNRRGFEKFCEMEQARIARKQSQGALLVLIDLDRFKEINDTHGHLAGDACLKHAADTLLGLIRISDGAARFGGDEFALLLTHTDPDQAFLRVEKIRRKLGSLSLSWQGHTLSFGASVGHIPLRDGDQYVTAFGQADKALYADKKQRRDSR